MDAAEETPTRKRAYRRKTKDAEPVEETQATAEQAEDTPAIDASAAATDAPAEDTDTISPVIAGEDTEEDLDQDTDDERDIDVQGELDDEMNEDEDLDLLDEVEDYDDEDYDEDEGNLDANADEEYAESEALMEEDADYDESEDAGEEAVRLTHLDAEGRAQMVDISGKPVTARTAVATAYVKMSQRTLDLLERQDLPKGDALTVAEVAGIMGAKRTSDLIPLCHPIPLTNVTVNCEVTPSGVLIRAEAATQAQTGVEMEALNAASVAALTIYDMCKGVDRDIVISDIRVNSKTGGVSGDYQAAAAPAPAEAPADPVVPQPEEVLDLDELVGEEEEEQIIPRSIQPTTPSRPATPYRRDSGYDANRGPRPYDRDRDNRSGGYQGNRTGGYQGGGYNRDNRGSYGNRPGYQGNRDTRPGGGYQGNRDTRPGGYQGGYNRDNTDRTRTPYNRPDARPDTRPGGYTPRDRDQGSRPGGYGGGYQGNRDRDARPGGYQGNRDRDTRPGGGYQGNRDRGTGGYQGNRDRGTGYTPKPGFGGFRDRNRDRDTE